MRSFHHWGIRTFGIVFIASILSPSVFAQTGYFFQSPSGGTGNWKTGVQNWGSTSTTNPPDHTWLSDGSERANFSTAAGTVTIDPSGVTTNGINFNVTGVTINGGTLNWFAGNVNVGSGNTGTIAAAIAGGGTTGFNKIGLGTVILSGANTFSSGLTVSGGGTLVGIAQTSGSPFSSGTVLLNTAVLRLNGIAATTTTTVGDFTAAGTSQSSIGTEQLIIDNSAGLSGGSVTTLAAGNLSRSGQGGALIVTAQNNTLGNGEDVTFTNGNSLLTNGILPAWIVQSAAGTGALDFVGYGANGLQTATYTSSDITTSGANDVVQSSGASAGGTAYALKTNGAINLSGSTLSLGSGLILNSGGSVTGGNITFGNTEGMVYFQPGAGAIGSSGSNITGNALTFVMAGAGTATINGNIVDNGAQPTSVILSAPILGSTIALNGTNSYTGGTTLSINATTATAGTLQLANDSAFGSGKVTTVIGTSGTSPNFVATGGPRTIANALDLGGGLNFVGTNGFVLTGPIELIGGRTLNNVLTAGSVQYGSAGSPSTITAGNPVSNGGDGVGKTLTITSASGATSQINDVIQDAGAAPTGSGDVTMNGQGTTIINSQSTYTGGTTLSGAGTTIPLLVSSNALPGPSFTAGPFGTGTLTVNNGTNQHLIPTGTNQFVSNAVSMSTGFAMDNFSGETFSLTFAGPIIESASGKFISNGFTSGGLSNFADGSLILGAPAAASTITIASGGNLNIAAISGPIVVNDVIQNGATAGSVAINPQNLDTKAVVLNGANTYSGGTTIGSGSVTSGGIVQIGIDSAGSPGSLTSGPFGTGAVTMNTTNANATPPVLNPVGGDRTVGNAITMTSGFFVANSASELHSLNLTGPITLGGTSRVLTNNMLANTTLTLGSGGNPQLFTLGSELKIQSQSGAGLTTINDQITSTGKLTVQLGGTVYLNNGNNNYSGGTQVTGGRLVANNTSGSATGSGAVTVTGSGAVGSGGTLSGTGSISGPITVSSTTAGSQGGVIAPGNSPGTINVGAMTWDPNGRYAFEYNADNNATGGGVNDLISGSGALNLANLVSNTAGSQFDLNLTPIAGVGGANQTYVIATFAGGTGMAAGDITGLFTFSGTFAGSPTVVVVDNGGGSQSLDLSFTAVPEPGCLMLLGAAAGLFGVRRPRRRRAA